MLFCQAKLSCPLHELWAVSPCCLGFCFVKVSSLVCVVERRPCQKQLCHSQWDFSLWRGRRGNLSQSPINWNVCACKASGLRLYIYWFHNTFMWCVNDVPNDLQQQAIRFFLKIAILSSLQRAAKSSDPSFLLLRDEMLRHACCMTLNAKTVSFAVPVELLISYPR